MSARADDGAAEPMHRGFEAEAGAGRRLVEKRRHDEAVRRARAFRRVRARRRKQSASSKIRSISTVVRSSIETMSYFSEPCHRAQAAAPRLAPPITTASTPSISARRTYTRWPRGACDIVADVVGANRQFALAAIDQHRELNRFGPSEIGQRVERRAHRAPGVEHVVDQHDAGAVERERDVAADQARVARRAAPVVAIRRNVERADRHCALAAFGHRLGQPLGEASRRGARFQPGRYWRRRRCARRFHARSA